MKNEPIQNSNSEELSKIVTKISADQVLNETEFVKLLKHIYWRENNQSEDLKMLFSKALEDKELREHIALSFETLPSDRLERLFSQYMATQLQPMLQDFFDALMRGTMKTVHSELTKMDEKLDEIRAVVYASTSHKIELLNLDVAKLTAEYLATQPAKMAPLASIYKIIENKLPIPEQTRGDKMAYVMKVLRHSGKFDEYKGFMFGLKSSDIKGNNERFAAQPKEE